jgi:hypothetical protein
VSSAGGFGSSGNVTVSSGICIAECPWMRPSARPTLCALRWLQESL